jgi:hypothetical protein
VIKEVGVGPSFWSEEKTWVQFGDALNRKQL